MGFGQFLRRLLGGAPRVAPTPAAKPTRRKSGPRDSTLMESVLSVDSLQFIGSAERSSNRRWVVGGMDRPFHSNPRQGELDGRAVLIDYPDDRVAAVIDGLTRPMECAASDVGTFVVNDATWGGGLSGDVRVFSVDGRELFRRRYEANVYNLDISKCGRHVVVQTCNASNGDGDLLEVFDVERGAVAFSTSPQTGWADRYAFAVNEDGSLKHLTVIHKELGRFKYAADGDFLDPDTLRTARLDNGGPEARVLGARAALETANGDPDRLAEVLTGVSRALDDMSGDSGDYRSIGLRVKGETLEALGRREEAIAAYESALALNPKVGVARKLSSLKKTRPAAAS